ncbi:hypothetical protein GOBAR_DD23204 [Gossypium barbadense]|nr:hypothetical protein GOBAR_DD23204 [Gossypium barbadense]
MKNGRRRKSLTWMKEEPEEVIVQNNLQPKGRGKGRRRKIDTSREDGESSDEEDSIFTSDDEIGEMRDILVDEQGRTYYNIGTTDDLENLPNPKSVQHKGDNLLEELE